ncbi:cytidine deaminase 1-like [Aristolochia californica]|uniref:cytidine deaminase 1-like n=1 Tax=Aristolochia californica TaxID=171875 RepID=UPI0035E15BD5
MAGTAKFVIESEEVEALVQNCGGTVLDLLASLTKSTKMLARPTISKYHVGAVGLSSDGRIFIGVNLEFSGLPLHHSIHAEQFLITNAAIHGATKIDYIAVSSIPCGHCRQFLQEIRGASEIKILVITESEEITYKPLSYLLPHRFGPDDLLEKEAPLLLESPDNGLVWAPRNGTDGAEEELRTAAVEAANRAHAPYTGCPSGVALMDSQGRVFAGSYSESAAYNPSLGPLQAAIVAYVAGGGGGYEEIEAAVLVEKEDAVVRQESTVRLLIQAISPHCNFRVFRCRKSAKIHSLSD